VGVRARRLIVGVLLVAAIAGGVAAWVFGSKPDWYERFRYPLEYESLVVRNARTFDLDPALVAAVIYAESRFDPKVESSAGAIGLMQLLPGTGKWIAATTGTDGFRVQDLYDPNVNVRYGSFYLRELMRKYDGNARIALAAYHAGQTNADRWLKQGGTIGFADTRQYVRDVLRARNAYRQAYGSLRTA
jgi:peptidoglycan lytic transglycosylase